MKIVKMIKMTKNKRALSEINIRSGCIPFTFQVGFNIRKVTKGNVTTKLWDFGGQPMFRSMWECYCLAVSVIVYESYFLCQLTLQNNTLVMFS